MPSLADLAKVHRSIGLVELAKRVWQQVGEDNLFAWAAALAYSWLFAVFPFMIFLMSLLPYLPASTRSAAEHELGVFARQTMPDQAADTLLKNVADILSKPRTGLLGVGLLLTLWGASGGLNMTITALDRCYEVDRGRPFYKQRPVAMGLTLCVATLVIVLMILLPIGTIAIKWLVNHSHAYVHTTLFWTWRILRYPMALLVMFTIVHVIYQYGPSIRQRFQFVTPGALFSVVVWLMLAFAFRLYVNKFGRYNETYGAVGGVAILLLFFYIDAAVLLVGAEINSEIDFEVLRLPRGSRDFRRPVMDHTDHAIGSLQPEEVTKP
jgi:membrane protein